MGAARAMPAERMTKMKDAFIVTVFVELREGSEGFVVLVEKQERLLNCFDTWSDEGLTSQVETGKQHREVSERLFSERQGPS